MFIIASTVFGTIHIYWRGYLGVNILYVFWRCLVRISTLTPAVCSGVFRYFLESITLLTFPCQLFPVHISLTVISFKGTQLQFSVPTAPRKLSCFHQATKSFFNFYDSHVLYWRAKVPTVVFQNCSAQINLQIDKASKISTMPNLQLCLTFERQYLKYLYIYIYIYIYYNL